MKKILSISIGNSNRNKTVNFILDGENFEISRIGTDGNLKKMKLLFEKNDGKVDAFGIGGFDLFIYAGKNKKIPFPEPNKIIKNIKTPVFDGSIMKLVLEPMVIEKYSEQFKFKYLNAFCLVGSDRFGMAEVLNEQCKQITYGDLIVSLGLPFPIKSFNGLINLSKTIGPVVLKLPFKWLYPTGKKAETKSKSAHKYFQNHDIIAGDFHYINRYAPDNLKNKIIITNSTTAANIDALKNRGVKAIITTTPQLNGRTFGTNVMEALLYLLINKQNPNHDDFRNIILKHKLDKGELFLN